MQRGMRGLVGSEEHDVAVEIAIGDGALRLQEGVLGPRRFKTLRDDVYLDFAIAPAASPRATWRTACTFVPSSSKTWGAFSSAASQGLCTAGRTS